MKARRRPERHPPRAEAEYNPPLPRFRYMLIDKDGQRVGSFEPRRLVWQVGDTFRADGAHWRIVEMLPEVSTAVVYHGVWVVEPV